MSNILESANVNKTENELRAAIDSVGGDSSKINSLEDMPEYISKNLTTSEVSVEAGTGVTVDRKDGAFVVNANADAPLTNELFPHIGNPITTDKTIQDTFEIILNDILPNMPGVNSGVFITTTEEGLDLDEPASVDYNLSPNNIYLKLRITDKDIPLYIGADEITRMLNSKVNVTDFRDEIDTLKADLNLKASVSALNNKANMIDVNEALSKKADAYDTENSLNAKADKVTVNAELSKKADKEFLDKLLNTKADKVTVNAELDKKASQVELKFLDKKLDDSVIGIKSNLEGKITNDIDALRKEIDTKTSKAIMDTLQKEVKTKASVDTVNDVKNTLKSKIDKKEFYDLNKKVNTKASVATVNNLENRLSETETEFRKSADDLKKTADSVSNEYKNIKNKVDKIHVDTTKSNDYYNLDFLYGYGTKDMFEPGSKYGGNLSVKTFLNRLATIVEELIVKGLTNDTVKETGGLKLPGGYIPSINQLSQNVNQNTSAIKTEVTPRINSIDRKIKDLEETDDLLMKLASNEWIKIVSPLDYDRLDPIGSDSPYAMKANTMYMVVKYNRPIALYLGDVLIAKRDDKSSIGFAYTFPMIF